MPLRLPLPHLASPRLVRLIKVFAAAAVSLLLLLLGANAYVVLSSSGEATDDVAALPHAQAAIVPGALVHEDGRMSSMLADRVERTLELWQAGKVDRILVSGDHSAWTYDEPDTMRKALLEAGVPGHAIFTDHAGFNTRATMVRAREVFDVDSAIVVTQGFHMSRSLYLAKAAGLEIHGLTADGSDYGRQGARSNVRELFSRAKAIADTALDSGVLLGPKIPITGDGRASWGPPPPPGTPPAGSPGR